MAFSPVHESKRWHEQVTEFLADGLPFDLTCPAAFAYLKQCEALVATMGSTDSLAAVRLLSAHVIASTQVPNAIPEVNTLSVEQMAQRLGDDVAHAYALVTRAMVSAGPETAHERVSAMNTVLDIAERHNEANLIPLGYYLLMVALLETGQIHLLDTAIMDRRLQNSSESHPHQFDPAGWFRCLRTILDGDAQLAEQQAKNLFTASNHQGSNALLLFTTQMGIIHWMSGRMEGAEDGFLAARREYPEQLLWPASLAWMWLTQGRTAAADALLRSLPDLHEIRRDRYWLSTLTVLAQIATAHGPRERAEQLREMLLPYAHHLVPVGNGVAFWGTCARTLGLLEERLGLMDNAREHLELAVELTARVGAQAWLAEAQIELAKFAIRRELTDIPAYNLLAQARATCEARGFTALAARAVHPARIRVFGRFEVVPATGVVAVWTSRKARELLKMLVASRGVATSREVFMEQLWPGQDPARLTNRFSVAVNTIRRALDPEKQHPRQHHVVIDGDSVRLNLEHLDIDLERFFALLNKTDDASRAAAHALYSRQVFPDEPYVDWAIKVRDDVDHAWYRFQQAPRQSNESVDGDNTFSSFSQIRS